jgi:hypothetical protein
MNMLTLEEAQCTPKRLIDPTVWKPPHKYMVEGIAAPLRISFPEGFYEMSSNELGAG